MKKSIITLFFIFFTTFCSAQIAIDSIKGYFNGSMIDSIYLQYTSHIPHIDTLVRGANLSAVVNINSVFSGCSTAFAVQKDTVFHLYNDSIYVDLNWGLYFGIWCDTTSICNVPINPRRLTSRFLFPTITSIEETEKLENKINIFPNPVRDNFTLNIEEEIQIHQVELIDLQGRLVKSYQNSRTALDVSTVSSGIYFVKITTAKGIAMKKIVVN